MVVIQIYILIEKYLKKKKMKMSKKDQEIENLKKQLAWFNDFADCVQGNHRAYDIACEYADEKEAEKESV